jgi:hypothetical protein
MEHRWNEIDSGKPKYSGGGPVPVPLCPPQIPHGLTRDRTRASAVGDLTSLLMVVWFEVRGVCLSVCMYVVVAAVAEENDENLKMNGVPVRI